MTGQPRRIVRWSWRSIAIAGAVLLVMIQVAVLLAKDPLTLSNPRIEVDQVGFESLAFDWRASWKYSHSHSYVLVIECHGERYSLAFPSEILPRELESFRIRGWTLPVGPCVMFVEKRDPFAWKPTPGVRVSNRLRFQWTGATHHWPKMPSPMSEPQQRFPPW